MDHKMVAKATMATEDRYKYNKPLQEASDKITNDLDIEGLALVDSKMKSSIKWIADNTKKVTDTNRKMSRGK